MQVGLLFLAIWLAPDSIDFGRIDTNQIVVVVLIAVLLVGVAHGGDLRGAARSGTRCYRPSNGRW